MRQEQVLCILANVVLMQSGIILSVHETKGGGAREIQICVVVLCTRSAPAKEKKKKGTARFVRPGARRESKGL